jgi:hypothetical protein
MIYPLIQPLFVSQVPDAICFVQLKNDRVRDLTHLCGKSSPLNPIATEANTDDASATITPAQTLQPNNQLLNNLDLQSETDDEP